VPEVNYTGQFAQLLRTHYQDIEFTRINVYGGQPFNVDTIVKHVTDQATSAKRNGASRTTQGASIRA
jgi:pyruvate/2-oxoacid:ferredoxin oxidoreductase alpha subunit